MDSEILLFSFQTKMSHNKKYRLVDEKYVPKLLKMLQDDDCFYLMKKLTQTLLKLLTSTIRNVMVLKIKIPIENNGQERKRD